MDVDQLLNYHLFFFGSTPTDRWIKNVVYSTPHCDSENHKEKLHTAGQNSFWHIHTKINLFLRTEHDWVEIHLTFGAVKMFVPAMFQVILNMKQSPHKLEKEEKKRPIGLQGLVGWQEMDEWSLFEANRKNSCVPLLAASVLHGLNIGYDINIDV
ncbi:unnamed protein product [Sphenostylis stenocarpa]|uniref:Uncharacterized protein n=1 Tax=Sphenostylis stenocarpa TaxID=92480 RepID=A0AA86V1P9_9FABA|nr:unnamed protein product [Sphenostylis stenocarpa]